MESIFSKRLKEERLNSNYTQQRLADLINNERKHWDGKETKISRVSITRYENGSRTPDYTTLCIIASVLNTDIDYLLGKTCKKHQEDINDKLNNFTNYINEVIDKDDLETNNLIWTMIDDFKNSIEQGIKNNNLHEIELIYSIVGGIINSSVNKNDPEIIHNFQLFLKLFCNYYYNDGYLKLRMEHLEELKKMEQNSIESFENFKESNYYKLLQSIELHGSLEDKAKYKEYITNMKKIEEDRKKEIAKLEERQKSLEHEICELKVKQNNIKKVLFPELK